MKAKLKAVRVRNLFTVHSGDCHAVEELDTGKVPLISCGDLNNGVIGYYDIPQHWQYSHAITVAYNGSWPLTTKFHPYTFGAKDDVAVLVPLLPMKDSVILYAAALLNRMIWRYSYGRKCFKAKLQDVSLMMPLKSENGTDVIDERLPEELFKKAFGRVSTGTKDAISGIFASEGK